MERHLNGQIGVIFSMQLFSSLLFGVSASLDALLMGMTYGLRRIHIGLLQNLAISLITLAGTCLSVGCGSLLGPLLPASMGTWIGSGILIVYGFYYLLHSMPFLRKKYRTDADAPTNTQPAESSCRPQRPRPLSFPCSLTLGVALSANNMGIGLTASVAGLSLAPAAGMTLFFSIFFLFLGNHLGKNCLSRRIKAAADPVSGALLILLGIWELWF